MVQSQPKLSGCRLLKVLPLTLVATTAFLRAEEATVIEHPPIKVVTTIVHPPEGVTHQAPKEGKAVIPLEQALQTALQVLLIGKETICMLTLSSNTFYMKNRVLFISARSRTSGQRHQLSRVNRG